MNVTIDVDDKAVRRALGELQAQAPYALQQAVNAVTKDAQTAIRQGYRDRFTLRRPSFIDREGAKITRWASKQEPVAELRVTEKAGFLEKFELGDEKRPADGRHIAIPIDARRNKHDIIPRGQRPRPLLDSASARAGRVFKTATAILQRVGRGASATLKTLYLFRTSTRTPKLLQFHATANATVDKQWRKRALEAVDKAIATARK